MNTVVFLLMVLSIQLLYWHLLPLYIYSYFARRYNKQLIMPVWKMVKLYLNRQT